jgi:hypothetical protein
MTGARAAPPERNAGHGSMAAPAEGWRLQLSTGEVLFRLLVLCSFRSELPLIATRRNAGA